MFKRKQYTKEFKLEAVWLANEPDQSFVQLAKNLGISASALHRWACELSNQGSVAFLVHGKAGLTSEQAEIKRLQRQLDITRQDQSEVGYVLGGWSSVRPCGGVKMPSGTTFSSSTHLFPPLERQFLEVSGVEAL